MPATELGNVHPTMLEALFSWKSLHCYITVVCTASFGMFFASNFKNYEHTDNDTFLTHVGALGAFANGASRYVWGLI
jgi:hypothetical protein